MIRGFMNHRGEAMISLLALDSANQSVGIDAAIDTGFNGELTLTSAHIGQLGLTSPKFVVLQLADGTIRRQQVYDARLNWDGIIRDTKVILIESKPLVGMKLLDGFRLTIDVIGGGPVTIEPIP